MAKRILLSLMLAAMGSGAMADTWSVGYGVVPGTFDFVIDDLVAGARDKQGSEDFSFGMIQILYKHSRPLSDNMLLTLTTGVGLPAGTQEFDHKKAAINAISTSSKNATNEGDGTEIQLTTVPVLLGGEYLFPMNNMSLSLGLSVGAILSALNVEMTDVEWTGTAPNETQDSVTVTYLQLVQTHFAVLANLGANFPLGNSDTFGVTIPIGFLSEVKGVGYSEVTRNNPTATQLSEENTGYMIGGFSWGVNVGWTRKY